jgi:ATP-dependent Clp protease ATP-binding subunit ClpA
MIVLLRGQKVMLDADLAALYAVPTKALNQAVKRNLERFPADFMFRLRRSEAEALNRSQPVTGSQKHRDPRAPPYAFSEHGAIMVATILNSARAVEVSIYVVRAFIQLRELLASNKALAKKLDELEARVHQRLADQDQAILEILRAIRQLNSAPTAAKRRPIGFVTPPERKPG